MKIHWIKLVVGAIAAEGAAILLLVCLVAVFGPKEAGEAQVYAEKLGRWVGPVAGAVLSFLGALWICRRLARGHLAHGALFGFLLAFIDVALLLVMRAPFQWIFVVSNAGKIIAGVAGGLIAARLWHSNIASQT